MGKVISLFSHSIFLCSIYFLLSLSFIAFYLKALGNQKLYCLSTPVGHAAILLARFSRPPLLVIEAIIKISMNLSNNIRSSRCKNYTILPHQKLTLLFYHIILQYLIYQMFYIFTTSFKYYFLILFNSYFILSS